jgi:predicted RNA-binding protein with PIN domain
VLRSAADAIVELQSYGVASTADKFLEQIKQEAAESKAAVEIATGSVDTQSIERERTARRIKASNILQQFEAEMGIVKPAASQQTLSTPTVGARTSDRTPGT